jgi:outer membrane receptor protein involved in Fe transport
MPRSILHRSASALMLLLVCFAFGVTRAAAQSQTAGAIGGLVKDPKGAVVQGATVTVRNEDTNKETTGTSDSEGRFRVVQLQPGNYTVTVASSGFGNYTQSHIVVEVGRVTSIDVPLAVGGAQESVEVTSEAPVINTTQQDFSNNINQTSINELPINGRRASNFALLAPGVVPEGGFGLNSFRGVAGILNNSTLDGGDNNNAFYGEERGRTRISYVVSQAAIREFQLNTSNYSAEYGRAAGGVINTVTKSGSNEFHGSGFFYDRNNRFGATNPLTTRPVPGTTQVERFKPLDKRYQFGGTIGGRIIKDKLFFFFAYDEQRRDFPGAAILSSQTYLNDSAAGSACTVTTGVNRTCLKALNPTLITDARINEATAFIAGLTGAVPRTQNQRIFFPKIDWNVNSSNTFTASFNRMRSASPAGIQTQPTTTSGIASFGDDFVSTDIFNARLTSTITPKLLNEFRFQWGRDNLFAFSQPPSAGEQALLPSGLTRLPNVSLTNGLSFGKPTFLERVANPDEHRQQYADTMTSTHGNHTFKFGFDVNHVNDLLDNLQNESGSYAYSNVNEFIIDYINARNAGALRTAGVKCFTTSSARSALTAGKCYTSSFVQGFGPTAFTIKTNDYNFFAQDDWRVSPRWTVNLGLRYEYEQLPKPQIPNSLPNLANQLVGPQQTNNIPADKNNFGPRIGFAYDLTGDGKTSVRGGYGIYYGRIINSTVINAISNTGVANSQRNFSIDNTNATTAATAPIFPNILPSAPTVGGAAAPNIVVFAPNTQAPLIHEGDFIVEREIMRNTVVSVSYLFSRGRNLTTFVDENLPTPQNATYTFSGGPLAGQTINVPLYGGLVPGTTTRVTRPDTRFGAITQIRSDINSNYDAVVFQINRRMTKGLQFLSHYTFSRSMDNGQNSQTFTTSQSRVDPFSSTYDTETRSNNDIPHRLVASAVWNPGAPSFVKESPVGKAIFSGWTIAPIFVAQSGNVFSAATSGSAPNSIAGGITGSGASGRNIFYERNAFRQPRIVNLDMRLSRRFHIKEQANIEFLAEAFNIFNRFQVTGINFTQYSFSGTTLNFQPAFGSVFSAGNSIYRERQVQFAVRFEF